MLIKSNKILLFLRIFAINLYFVNIILYHQYWFYFDFIRYKFEKIKNVIIVTCKFIKKIIILFDKII